MYRRVTAAALFVVLFAAADWTRFRGPEGRGISEDKGLPTTWSATENLVWKTPLPGYGSSSPVIVGDKIVLTCYSGYGFDADEPGSQQQLALHVVCLDRTTGRTLWEKKHEPELPETDYDAGRINLHGYASSTAITDGEAVFIFFGKTGVFKYSLDGEQIWQASVGTQVDSHRWGSGASLILHGDLLIVNASCESKSIRGLKQADGAEVWRVDGINDSWSTPLVVTTADGGQELVVVERFKVLGLNPATGEQLWEVNKESDYVCPSVFAHEDVVYVINSRFKAAAFAIRTGGRGDVTDSHVLWINKGWTTRVCTPVYHAGHLYAMDQAGYASCLNAETGEEVYRERMNISGSGDKIYASIVAGDGKLYGVTREDGTVVLALTPEFKELARNYLGDDSIFNATPAIDNGQLLIRSDKALYCIGK